MTRAGRVLATTRAGWASFLRRRTAVFFTFFFPAIIVVIFGALVGTQPTGGGLFAEPTGWYLAGYLGVVVLFTPLSRVGSEVSRHREGAQFEKLTRPRCGGGSGCSPRRWSTPPSSVSRRSCCWGCWLR